MRTSAIVALIAVAIALWLPYVSLRFYWIHLLATVPGAQTGEVSGPINYFLPRLFWIAIVGTALAIVFGVRRAWLASSN